MHPLARAEPTLLSARVFSDAAANFCHAGLSGQCGSTTTKVRAFSRASAALRRAMRCEAHAEATASTNGGLARKTPLRGRHEKQEPTEPKAASTSPAAEQKVGCCPTPAISVVLSGLANSSASSLTLERKKEKTAGGHAAYDEREQLCHQVNLFPPFKSDLHTWLPPAFSCPPCKAKTLANVQ